MALNLTLVGQQVAQGFGFSLLGSDILIGISIIILAALAIAFFRIGLEGGIAILVGFAFVLVDLAGLLDSTIKFVLMATVGLILGIGIVRTFLRQ